MLIYNYLYKEENFLVSVMFLANILIFGIPAFNSVTLTQPYIFRLVLAIYYSETCLYYNSEVIKLKQNIFNN
jgi:hypothetical protein